MTEGSKFYLKLAIFFFFGPTLPEKGISGLKQKNNTFASVYGRYLIYCHYISKFCGMGADIHKDILMSPSSRRGNDFLPATSHLNKGI